MADRMQAAVVRSPHDLVVEQREVPVPQEGEVLLRILRTGICGTDYHIYSGNQPFLAYPRLIGHELAGRVLSAPAGSGWAEGQLAVINPYVACGTCHACKQGLPNACMKIAVLGVHRDGGMAEYLTLPLRNLIPAGGLTADQAASVEFLAIGAHAVRRGGVTKGRKVLVVGAGPIGIGAAIFARVAGGEVFLADRDAPRLKLAEGVTGAAGRIVVDDTLAGQVAEATGGNGFDAVFDATGHAGSMEASFAHVAHGGVLVMVGLHKGTVTFSDPDFHRREMTVMASRNATRVDFDTVMAGMASGEVDVGRLITHRTRLHDVPRDLPLWAGAKDGLIKAMVEVAE